MDKNSLAFSRRVFTHFLVLMVPASALTWLAGPVTAQTGGLVAAYSFNEGTGTTVADASGNGNAGTLSGTTWTNGGKYGSALVFNGTSARVTINNSASLQLTAGVELEAWGGASAGKRGWRGVIYKWTENYYL